MFEQVPKTSSNEIQKERIMEKESIVSFEELEKRAFDREFPRKKVLLIDGNLPTGKDIAYRFGDDESLSSGITPFGLARIAGYMDKYGVPCSIVRLQDFDNPSKKESLQQLLEQSDIIGMSALTPSINEAYAFLASVKEAYPSKTTIGGAEHFALDYEWILQHQNKTGVDVCCTMQGELPMLSLALNVSVGKVGSVAFAQNSGEEKIIKKNVNFPRLNERSQIESELARPVAARRLPKEWEPVVVPEIAKYFERCGSSQTGSGCNHKCTFCTNEKFLGRFESTLETAKQEIRELFADEVDFLYLRNAMLNFSDKHLMEFVDFMRSENEQHEKKISWYAFMSAQAGVTRFKEMAEAGCIMIAVGVEDVIGKREEIGKDADLDLATRFVDEAKEHVLVRTLLIMGLKDHYRLSREEIKRKTLAFMKSHPQAVYRINSWTPIVGAEDFDNFQDYLTEDIRKNPKGFKEHDTMHGVIDHKKMYDELGVPEEQRWVKDPKDWIVLRNEIMVEYLNSPEHANFLETLKGKSINGRQDILYNIAMEFKNITLGGIEKV